MFLFLPFFLFFITIISYQGTDMLARCASEMCDESGGMVHEGSAFVQDLSERVTEDLPTGK